ncbi:acyl-CoA dehydrogenase [Streptomyces spectabilis]|uniref:Acyl-CoA oxidase n=1 Tax=Streptomyces spectabilis TaxID=68270 RepID=A0A7W8B303_STRST|nr:acyl-CoA dehydrogenase [Streptomyces spectabilis]MBB5107947.1 acyl-CoA oxidase [Streptomyces spectabilis]MCI3899724.1 acyl-CoA oxidase [Streptomyces spectabilis]GGV52189.1 acyl-CoA oxidase [Streptomyces spectabilis]
MPAPDLSTLRGILFDDGHDDAHGHWRKAVSTDVFRYRPGSDRERWELAYARLRALNAELAAPHLLPADPRGLAALHEWAAVVDGATATVAGIHYNFFLGSLHDDTVSVPRDLSAFHAMRRIGVFLCTERAHGNDVAALETTASYDRDSQTFVLHTPNPGAAKFMPNTSPAGGPKSAVVAARLVVEEQDHGVFLFLAPLTDTDGPLPGVTVTALPARTGSPVDHCVTSFDHVQLPRTALLQGPHGRLTQDGRVISDVRATRKRVGHAIGRVTVGKLCMSAATLGGSRAALAIAVRYAHRRTISAPVAGQRVPLVAHRSHHAPLLHGAATAYAMTFLHRATVQRWIAHEPDERASAEREVAVAKGWITWQARALTIEARERCGARGLFPENGLAEYPANADGAITAEGDNLAIWCKAGAEMIFGQEPAPQVPPATGNEDNTDPRFLVRLLSAAERRSHLLARTRLRGAPAGDTLGRWNNACAPALDMVDAHVVKTAANAFLAACARVDHAPTRDVLTDLCALFLLERLHPRSGMLLAQGAMTAAQVEALPDAVHTLVTRLSSHLLKLTDAFGVPEEHLMSLPLLKAI